MAIEVENGRKQITVTIKEVFGAVAHQRLVSLAEHGSQECVRVLLQRAPGGRREYIRIAPQCNATLKSRLQEDVTGMS
jgi:hypothetical protein